MRALAFAAVLLAAAPAAAAPMRGTLVDIGGGRRMRAVCDGVRGSGPTVVFESGAFGASPDWAAVQARLGGRMRSCAYDRAGLGLSDPGPAPRDSAAIARDLDAMLAALGETGPLILVAHSMAPVHAYTFALTHPGRVVGLVLVDAVTPEAAAEPTVRRWVAGFAAFSWVAAPAARLGLLALASGPAGDGIGLPEPAASEKRRFFALPRHNRWAAAEARAWAADAEAVRALGPLPAALPIAVVSAGRRQPNWEAMQALPALRADRGSVEQAAGADHATLLGPRWCDAVIRGIDFVREAAVRP